jgi:hypothetical protein
VDLVDVRPRSGGHGGEVLRVGPARTVKSIGEAARQAQDGTTVEVDAGEYFADVAIWTQRDLVIRAVGGRVRLRAMGASAEGKSIWVVRGGRIAVNGFDFEGTRVPDGNGAGIRFEKGMLSVKDCRFFDNETGLIAGNDPSAELSIENSEFGSIRRLRGQNHNLYVGSIAKLTVVGSYFHHGAVGHLLKTRAAVNQIFYNRLTDESGGSASYELEFPEGGVALVIGNIVQQSSTTENAVLISYGAEGYKGARENALVLVHNTLVDNRPAAARFLRVAPGNVAIKAMNNLLVGNDGRLDSAGPGEYRNNFNVDWHQFVRASREDYRLLPSATC